ncbi:ATP-binding cassette domain-containing protein [Pseudorhizobium tarimense]|uniref:ATP-binding cassette domain-containing protein n=1 Tax=Pseudorhizobium tarimense TaxID=1079109 RepID=UPI00289D94F0|nr:ATP-binding cassette domain-containing protein [Pseudorhizobium tarimense]
MNFELKAGETLCLAGESGSGKSVTSLATMGLLPKASLKVSSGDSCSATGTCCRCPNAPCAGCAAAISP